MADWLAPFHLPKFTTEDFEKQKDTYNKEKGYTITLPAWDDIILYKTFKPMTKEETALWAGRGPNIQQPIYIVPEKEIKKWSTTRELPQPYTQVVTVKEVTDGDTFTIEEGNLPVRVYGIDAPELYHGRLKPGQPMGEKSKAFLSSQLTPGTRIILTVRDVNHGKNIDGTPYTRLVAEPITISGVNISQLMVKTGHAEPYNDFIQTPDERKIFDNLQSEAKSEKKGIWSMDTPPETPADYRARTEEKEEKAKFYEEWRDELKLQIPPLRLEEIRAEKKKKQEKFLAQLASPSPKLARSAGAVMTALDDLQDALSTLACIGMIAAVVVGGTTAAIISGPVGWIAGAAALLSMINPYSRLKGPRGKALTGRGGKKNLEKFSDKNPFSKKSRAKVAARMKKFRPSVANACEALQVTAGIFGIGLSLGPIMGFAQDVVFGIIRELAGQKVTFKTSPPKVEAHVAVAQRALKAQAVLHGVPWKSELTDEIMSLITANLALQVVEPYLQEWNPFDQVENLASAMIEAPRPTNILSLEIIEEAGKSVDQVCNWPQNGEQFISLGELQEATAPQAAENLTHFAQANPKSVEAFIAGQNAHDFALGAIEAIEGPGQVEVEYSRIERIVLVILDNGWCYPDDITDAQVQKFEDWCYVHEYMNTPATARDIWRYAQVFCDFTWAKSPDEFR